MLGGAVIAECQDVPAHAEGEADRRGGELAGEKEHAQGRTSHNAPGQRWSAARSYPPTARHALTTGWRFPIASGLQSPCCARPASIVRRLSSRQPLDPRDHEEERPEQFGGVDHQAAGHEQEEGGDGEQQRGEERRGATPFVFRISKLGQYIHQRYGQHGQQGVDQPGRAGPHAKRQQRGIAGRVFAEPATVAHQQELLREVGGAARFRQRRSGGGERPTGHRLRLEEVGDRVLHVGHALEHIEGHVKRQAKAYERQPYQDKAGGESTSSYNQMCAITKLIPGCLKTATLLVRC